MAVEPVTIGRATLYLGDCRDVLPTLGNVDAVVTDPPYGVFSSRKYSATGRGWRGFHSSEKDVETLNEWDWPPSDLEEVLRCAPDAVVWGGNYFLLPPSRCWLVWAKPDAVPTQASIELAWTTLDRNSQYLLLTRNPPPDKQHPTQKPLRLMKWCLGFLPDAEIVCDPFMGSGTTGVAAVQMGKAFVGIERDHAYFSIACKRVEEAQRQGDFLIGAAA